MANPKKSLFDILVEDCESNLLPRHAINKMVGDFYNFIGKERFEAFVYEYQRNRITLNGFISCLVSSPSLLLITGILEGSGKQDY